MQLKPGLQQRVQTCLKISPNSAAIRQLLGWFGAVPNCIPWAFSLSFLFGTVP